jgi:rhamnulokinase
MCKRGRCRPCEVAQLVYRYRAVKRPYRFLAIDLGAESGRVVEGELEDGRLDIEEIHRFRNEIVNVHGRLYWDLFALFREVKQGLRLCGEEGGRRFDSVGVDTWGVDFGLLGADGSLLGMPRAYRDSEFKGAMAKFLKRVPKQRVYELTGIQFLNINTLYQLHALKLAKSPPLAQADALLFMPDLFNYLLTGLKTTEFTIATTSQLYDPAKRAWAKELFEALGVPARIMQEVVGPGSHIGKLRKDVCDETGFPRGSVVTTASHDTAAAVAGIPAEGDDWAFISSGTWSLVGVETRQPYMGEDAMRHNFTNEGGVCGTFRLLKNVTGLWLLRRCVEEWQENWPVDYESLLSEADRVPPLDTVIDPDWHMFAGPHPMSFVLPHYCHFTRQRTPVMRAPWARVILNSLALKYRIVLDQLRTFYKQPINRIHVVGGGVRNRLLCQLTADATGLPVHAGPVEATAIGNLMVQAMAAGCVRDLAEIRAVVRRSFDVQVYEPRPDVGDWWKRAEERLRVYMPGSKRRWAWQRAREE